MQLILPLSAIKGDLMIIWLRTSCAFHCSQAYRIHMRERIGGNKTALRTENYYTCLKMTSKKRRETKRQRNDSGSTRHYY